MREAQYQIIEQTNNRIIIRDVGPWNIYLTITNDVENVVKKLINQFGHSQIQQLLYYDSENNLDEIIIVNGKFAGFKPFRD